MCGHGVEKCVVIASWGVMEMLAEGRFADVGGRVNGSILCLPAPLVKEDLTFRPTDTKTAWVD
jgi:hypothetical protein